MKAYALEEGLPIASIYEDKILSALGIYKSLGIEFNCPLMVIKWLNSEQWQNRSKVSTLLPNFRNKLIPLEYMKMLANNIIIPTLKYEFKYLECDITVQRNKKGSGYWCYSYSWQ